jgi:hypothetical protein
MSATLGGWLGGVLGDYASSRWASKGRICVAFVSVAGGIPLHGLFVYSKTYHSALLWIKLFNLWGAWPPSAALRPICADLTRNNSERAQIISMWIVLEEISGACFGAPLVGYLTSSMLGGDESGVLPTEEANVLAFHLRFLSTFFWSICSFFWIAIGLMIPKSLSISQCHDTKGNESSEDTELNPLV